ncbi:MAG TPA: hypothetical protein VLC50_00850 [Actinomycetes bacterium]|nr:hypothetical protein [Actinomycetes bacterium]
MDEPTTYRGVLGEVTRQVALPHAYTLLLWAVTTVTIIRDGFPTITGVLLLLVGAGTGYFGISLLCGPSRGTARVALHRKTPRLSRVPTLMLFAAVGLCWLLTLALSSVLVWFAVGLVATVVYLVGLSLQIFTVTHRAS